MLPRRIFPSFRFTKENAIRVARVKITIIQGAFLPVPPVRGGAVERLWHRLAKEFASCGHEVVQISRRYSGLPDKSREDDVHHIRVSGYGQPANGLWLKFLDLRYSLRAVRRVPQSDIIITNTFWAPLLLRRRPGVYISVERMPKGQMRLYRRAARLRTCSRAVRDAILAEDPAAGPRVCVVPNPLPEVPSVDVPWHEKEPRILFVGRVHPEKGIELLLKAFVLAKTGGGLPDWKLEIVGPSQVQDGGGGADWIRSLQTRHCHPDVEWTGPLFRSDDLAERYRRARIFVYPSLAEQGETFGLAPLEAMSWGAVPVVSALACFKDFITPQQNGLGFDHRGKDSVQTLAALLADLPRQPLEALSRAALGVRITHAPERIAAQFLDDFARIVHASAGKS
jgi:glycosyltransferase involved in cell wall biosynthesis